MMLKSLSKTFVFSDILSTSHEPESADDHIDHWLGKSLVLSGNKSLSKSMLTQHSATIRHYKAENEPWW